MKKAELLHLLADLTDDDEVVIKCDGGLYWTSYLDEPKIKVGAPREMGNELGHPGGKVLRVVRSKKMAIISN